MKILLNTLLVLSMLILISCGSKNGNPKASNFNVISSGERISQSGMSYVPPTKKTWDVLTRTSYKTIISFLDKEKLESVIIGTLLFNTKEQKTKEDFMAFIKNGREATPNTGRYEVISQSLSYYENIDMCIKHRMTSKDLGKRINNQYAIYEEYGMSCVHPDNPKIGVWIEISRKAPFDYKNESFDKWGEELLKSVKFSKFKI